jgi:hypothetical protein
MFDLDLEETGEELLSASIPILKEHYNNPENR